MTDVANLFVNIGLDPSGFTKGMNRVKTVAERNTRTIRKAFSSIAGPLRAITGKLAGLTAGLGAAATAFLSVKNVIDAMNRADGLAKTADKLGTTTEALAGLRFAAEQTGASASTMDSALQRLSKNISEVASGVGESADSFQMLGISASSLASLAPEKQMGVLADALKEVSSQSNRVRIATDLFGRSGVALLNTLSEGSAGLEKYAQEADKLGIALSRVDAKQIENANDAINRAKKAFEGVFNQLSVKLAPIIEDIATRIVDWATASGNMARVVDAAMDIVRGAILRVITVWNILKTAWNGGKLVISAVAIAFLKAFKDIREALNTAAQFWSNVFGAMEATAINVWEQVAGSVKVMWAAIKVPIAQFTQWFGGQMASMLEKAGRAMVEFGIKGGASVLGVGQEIQASTGIAALVAEKNFNKVAKEVTTSMDTASKNAEKAWDNIFNIEKFDTSEIDGKIAYLEEAMIDSFVNIDEAAKDFFGSNFAGTIDETIAKAREAAEASLEIREENNEAALESESKYLERDLALMQDQMARRIQAEKQGAESINDLWETSLQTRLNVTSNILGNLATLAEGQGKKMFETAKVLNIAQAVMNTWAAANGALRDTPGPFFVRVAAAATTAAVGIMNVKKIAGMSYGSKGGSGAAGGASSGGGTSSSQADGSGQGGGGMSRNINIGIQGSSFSQNDIRSLIGNINEELDDNTQLRAR